MARAYARVIKHEKVAGTNAIRCWLAPSVALVMPGWDCRHPDPQDTSGHIHVVLVPASMLDDNSADLI